jgi:hypothetical protein
MQKVLVYKTFKNTIYLMKQFAYQGVSETVYLTNPKLLTN